MPSRLPRHLALGASLLFVAASTSLPAQQAAPQAGTLSSDLIWDVGGAEKKLLDLARAIPAEKYAWRPGTGVRSVGEVLQHIAADNYLLASPLGAAIPAATGMKAEDYKTVQAYEMRKIGRDEIIRDLEASFAHLKAAMRDAKPDAMGKEVKMFGQSFTTQRLMVMTATHLHEHLGQLIAYARSNGVVPPWSSGG